MSLRWKTGSHSARSTGSSRPADAENTGWWNVTTFHFDGLFCSSRSSHAAWKRVHSVPICDDGHSAPVQDGSPAGVRKVVSRVAFRVMKRTPW